MTSSEERIERAKSIRDAVLKLVDEKGSVWEPKRGPECRRFENQRFIMLFYVKPPGQQGLPEALYGLELWFRPSGKVLNLSWGTAGEDPQITTFRRGEWEPELLALANPT